MVGHQMTMAPKSHSILMFVCLQKEHKQCCDVINHYSADGTKYQYGGQSSINCTTGRKRINNEYNQVFMKSHHCSNFMRPRCTLRTKSTSGHLLQCFTLS